MLYFNIPITKYKLHTNAGVLSLSALLLGVVSPLLDLHCSLTLHTCSAAECSAYISYSVSLNVVPLPGLLSEQQGWYAGHDAAQDAVQQPTFTQIIGCLIGQTGAATQTTTTNTTVTKAVAESLLPFSSHCDLCYYQLYSVYTVV